VVNMGTTRVREVDKLEEAEEKPRKKEFKKVAEVKKEIIRLANTDLDANKSLYMALTGIKGVGYSISRALCKAAGFDPTIKLNILSEQDREKLENVIFNPGKFGLPVWILNRRRDRETGEDLHLTGSDLDVARKFDIQRMIDIRTWKGVRHMHGMPVRGQRTRSSFRKGRTVGVIKKAVRLAMQKSEEKK